MITIGNRIRKLRDIKNIKQDDIAKELGMSQSNYSRIENDEIKANDDALEKIASIFKMSKDELTNVDENTVNFNNCSGSAYKVDVMHNYAISPEIKKLYDDKITLLEEKIKWLENK